MAQESRLDTDTGYCPVSGTLLKELERENAFPSVWDGVG